MPKASAISLDEALDVVVGSVTLRGVEYPVMGLNAPEYQMVQAIDAGSLESEAPVFACIRRIVPGLPEDCLTLPVAGAILGVARGAIRKVEDALPNSSGPTKNPTSAETPLTTDIGSPAI